MSTDALTGGQWERHGLTFVWVPDQLQLTAGPQRLDRHAAMPERAGRRTKYRTTICECGCLIVLGENCPACLVWAERDVIRASWRTQDYYHPNRQEQAA